MTKTNSKNIKWEIEGGATTGSKLWWEKLKYKQWWECWTRNQFWESVHILLKRISYSEGSAPHSLFREWTVCLMNTTYDSGHVVRLWDRIADLYIVGGRKSRHAPPKRMNWNQSHHSPSMFIQLGCETSCQHRWRIIHKLRNC